jgi:hypothetical protein
MFPVRYELNSYILFKRNSVFKGLINRRFDMLRLVIRMDKNLAKKIFKISPKIEEV